MPIELIGWELACRGNLDKSIYYYGEALKACPNFAQVRLLLF
jgi:hypothetical protein